MHACEFGIVIDILLIFPSAFSFVVVVISVLTIRAGSDEHAIQRLFSECGETRRHRPTSKWPRARR